MKLTVFVHFEGPHHARPSCFETLEQLAHSHFLEICALYNGFPLNYDHSLRQLARNFSSRYLPLAVSRPALLGELLGRSWQGELCMWLDGHALWNPPELTAWRSRLDAGANAELQGIMPTRISTPANAADPRVALREAQALAQNPPQPNLDLRPCQPEALPACFAWLGEHSQALGETLSQADLPRMLEDRATRIWAPQPAAGSDLSPEAACHHWQALRQGELSALHDLLALSPASPALYRQALRLQPEQGPAWLEQAFARGQLSPELLQAAYRIYHDRPEAALACARLAQGLYGLKLGPEADQDDREAKKTLNAFLARYPNLSRPARLSVCLIVKDEMLTLERCLASVAGLADEIIVVDTGSSDGTPALAARLGARVIDWPWQGDFAAARNVSLAHATGDWILVLDADEYLEPAARALLWRFLSDPPPGLPRCQLQIANHNQTGETGLIHYVVRLFPRHPQLRYQGRIHEELVYLGPGPSAMPLIEGLMIQHTGYLPEVYQLKQKATRNLTLLRQQQAEAPERPEWMFYLGDSLVAAGEPAEALTWFERALARWSTLSAAEANSPLAHRTAIKALRASLDLERPEQALSLAQAQASRLAEIPDYWYYLGRAHLALAQEPAAIAAFEHCLTFRTQQNPLVYYDPNLASRAPLYQLMQIYRRQLLTRRLQAPQALFEVIGELLELYPDGVWLAQEFNLFALLAQLCAWCYRAQGTLPLTWLQPYQTQTAAQLAILALSWLTATAGPAGSPFSLDADQIALFGSSQDFRNQLCQSLWSHSALGRGLADTIFALANLLSPAPETCLWHTQLWLQAGTPDRALSVLAEALLIWPAQPVLLNNQAMLLFQTGQVEPALTQLEALLYQQPDFVEAQENLARIRAWHQRQTN